MTAKSARSRYHKTRVCDLKFRALYIAYTLIIKFEKSSMNYKIVNCLELNIKFRINFIIIIISVKCS